MAPPAIAHNKVMVIDQAVVITGSFNLTKATEQNNTENLFVVRSQNLAKVNIENWERRQGHAESDPLISIYKTAISVRRKYHQTLVETCTHI